MAKDRNPFVIRRCEKVKPEYNDCIKQSPHMDFSTFDFWRNAGNIRYFGKRAKKAGPYFRR